MCPMAQKKKNKKNTQKERTKEKSGILRIQRNTKHNEKRRKNERNQLIFVEPNAKKKTDVWHAKEPTKK